MSAESNGDEVAVAGEALPGGPAGLRAGIRVEGGGLPAAQTMFNQLVQGRTVVSHSTCSGPLQGYEVLKPFDVQAGIVGPAFGQPGGGIQYMSPQTVADLIEGGFIKPVG